MELSWTSEDIQDGMDGFDSHWKRLEVQISNKWLSMG